MKKSGKKLMGAVMIGIVVSAVMTALMPLAAAVTITKFEITPANNRAGATSAYIIQVNTTGFQSFDITIPAGFRAKIPSAGELIARVDLWWDTPSPGTQYGYVTFTANVTDPSQRVDVFADIGGATATLPGMEVNYAEGATTSIKSPFGAQPERAKLRLPTAVENGWLNITGLPDPITNVTVSIGEFVKNPVIAGDYEFTADGVSETVHISAIPVPVVNTIGLLALVGILSIVLATLVKRKRT
ncbi:MAG: hypothetical protein IBX41_03215 [Methanophagales archaeon]|nr:hypothetical protein [Methanophagales archaeon]